MDNIDKLIGSLSADTGQVKSVAPVTLFSKWILGSILWIAFMKLFFGTRPDILEKFNSTLFVSEIISLALVVISTAIAVTYISYPDIRQRPKIVLLPLIPLLAFIVTMYMALMNDVPHTPSKEPGYMCLICISVLSSIPALIIFIILRRQATTHPYVAGLLALLASSALGNLVFRFTEQNDDIAHLITWHYLPILGFSLIGILLGKRFLKW